MTDHEDMLLTDETVDDYFPEGDEVDDMDDEDGMKGKCDLCGEPYDATSPLPSKNEVGEFVAPDDTHVVAHAQCGITSGYDLA